MLTIYIICMCVLACLNITCELERGGEGATMLGVLVVVCYCGCLLIGCAPHCQWWMYGCIHECVCVFVICFLWQILLTSTEAHVSLISTHVSSRVCLYLHDQFCVSLKHESLFYLKVTQCCNVDGGVGVYYVVVVVGFVDVYLKTGPHQNLGLVRNWISKWLSIEWVKEMFFSFKCALFLTFANCNKERKRTTSESIQCGVDLMVVGLF